MTTKRVPQVSSAEESDRDVAAKDSEESLQRGEIQKTPLRLREHGRDDAATDCGDLGQVLKSPAHPKGYDRNTAVTGQTPHGQDTIATDRGEKTLKSVDATDGNSSGPTDRSDGKR